MRKNTLPPLHVLLFSLILIFQFSCSKDTDLLYDYVLAEEQEAQIGKYIVDDTFFMSQTGSMVLDVLANDTFNEDDNVTIVATSEPSNGTVAINSDNTLTYTADTEEETVDTFTYTAEVVTPDETVSTETGSVAVNTNNSGNTSSRTDNFVACTAGNGATYNPTSSTDIQNAANAGKTAVITNSFDCSGCTFASGQTIVPSGGVITGTNINVNGACIIDDFSQLFTSTVTFKTPYNNSRLSPEAFGANGGDANADDTAFNTFINQNEYGIGKIGSNYVKNQEVSYTRSGVFDFNMNSSKISTTNASALSHGTSTQNNSKYLFMFSGIDNIGIYNGEFDGNNLASRLFLLEKMERYYFDNVHVHDYLAPANAYARGVAFYIKPDGAFGFVEGGVYNSTIENIGATSDNNANNAPYGVSKGFYYLVKNDATANIYHDNLIIRNIYGDDAEGFFNAPSTNYNHNTNSTVFHITNSFFYGCQRRSIKLTASNAVINNNLFESATNTPIFAGAQAAMVHLFSTSSGADLQNVTFTNNTISVIGSGENQPFAITDIVDLTMTGNTIQANVNRAGATIGLGNTTTGGGLYTGFVGEAVNISNNTFINVKVIIGGLWNTTNAGPTLDGNTFTFNNIGSVGKHWGVFGLNPTSGAMPGDPITFTNTTVNVIMNQSDVYYGGMFNTQGMEPKGLHFNNVTVNYTGGSSPLYSWAYTGKSNTNADYDSTNSIINCTITGASGTGAVFVKGSDNSVVISNSFGDGSTPITVK